MKWKRSLCGTTKQERDFNMYTLANKAIFVAVKVAIIALAIASSACQQQYDYPKDGKNGSDGRDGLPGTNGSSCSIHQLANGARISCTDGTEAVVLNGVDGQDAEPGVYDVAEVVDPCGKQAAFDEVLLKLKNGQIMAHFASGANQFLALIGPGNYSTTDGTHCYFTITNTGEVTNEHN